MCSRWWGFAAVSGPPTQLAAQEGLHEHCQRCTHANAATLLHATWARAAIATGCVRAVCRVVLYVPSAFSLTRGGYFLQRDQPSAGTAPGGGPLLFDTPLAAKHILKALHDVHAKQLQQLPVAPMPPLASPPSAGAGAAAPAEASGPDAAAASPNAPPGAKSLLDVVVVGMATEDVSLGALR